LVKEQMMNPNKESGFSIIELLVASLMTMGLIGAVFTLVGHNQRVFITESNVTDMNENMRTAVFLLTRDIQSAGMGLPSRNSGSFASIFYINGASGAPDSVLIINGDPYAPTTDVTDKVAGSPEFSCVPPPDVTVTGSGTSQQMTYLGAGSVSKAIYKIYSADPRMYLCYDDTKAMVLSLTSNGQIVGAGSAARLRLLYNSTTYANPPTTFGATIDTGEPEYDNAKIAPVGSLIGYRINRATNELERTEDLTNWYSVARGVIDFQLEFRLIGKDAGGNTVETVTTTPTERRNIRSVTVTITSETPDLRPVDRGYRRSIQKFEAAPRNFNLLNNTNLSADRTDS
jgi:Tfp pilus assembly protein PilW